MVGNVEQQAVTKMGLGPQWKLLSLKVGFEDFHADSCEAGRDMKAERISKKFRNSM